MSSYKSVLAFSSWYTVWLAVICHKCVLRFKILVLVLSKFINHVNVFSCLSAAPTGASSHTAVPDCPPAVSPQSFWCWLMMIENSVHLMPIPRTVHEIWIFHFAALNLSPDFLLSQVRHQHDHSNESRVMSQCVRPGRDIMATFSTPHFLLFVFVSQTPGSHPVSLLPIVQSAFVLPRVAKCTQKANRQMSTEEFPWKKMT